MSGFLGTPGALAELRYRGGLSVSTDRPVSSTRTLGGKRKSFVGPRGRREWDVSFDLIGSRDMHGLLAVAHEVGPVCWYPADAVAGNLLSPQAAGFEDVPPEATGGGLSALPDGTVSRSLVRAEPGVMYIGKAHGGVEYVPVVPGESISFGAWTVGDCQFSLFWRGSTTDEGVPGPQPATIPGGPSWAWREATVTAPQAAGYVGLAFQQCERLARPTISWGASAQDRPGRGCPKAVVHGLSEALTLIAHDDAYGSIGVTITEVG